MSSVLVPTYCKGFPTPDLSRYEADRRKRVKIIHIPAELIRKDIQKLEEYIQKSITNRNHGTKK
jgi:hypothetical protein